MDFSVIGVAIVAFSIVILFLVGMLIFGFLQIFSRFILRTPIGWSEELLTYSFTWTSFIGASGPNQTDSVGAGQL